jgi:hypothetical protein
MQRGVRAQVPRITRKCGVKASVSGTGTVPPGASSASAQ